MKALIIFIELACIAQVYSVSVLQLIAELTDLKSKDVPMEEIRGKIQQYAELFRNPQTYVNARIACDNICKRKPKGKECQICNWLHDTGLMEEFSDSGSRGEAGTEQEQTLIGARYFRRSTQKLPGESSDASSRDKKAQRVPRVHQQTLISFGDSHSSGEALDGGQVRKQTQISFSDAGSSGGASPSLELSLGLAGHQQESANDGNAPKRGRTAPYLRSEQPN